MKLVLPIIILHFLVDPFVTNGSRIESNQLSRRLVLLNQLFSSHKNNQNNSTYSILDSEAIYDRLKHLQDKYPNYATLENAQDVYNLPAAGSETDCLFERVEHKNISTAKGCKNWIFTIEDDTEKSNNQLPEIFLSSGMHGDETLGPTALLELASLLLEVAHCESLPNAELSSDMDDQLSEALYCRRTLTSRGITNEYRKWIARLVATRRIVIVPIINSLGFFRGEHKEDGIDPATDFPFDNKDSKRCFETVSARVINEIFRNHVFYIAINFHSGRPLIAYNWATPSYLNKHAPDNEAQHEIANNLASFSGMNSWASQHSIGPMNQLLFKTKGTLQDWAYAGSWLDSKMLQCNPTTYNGYPKDKSVYNDSHLRALMMLVDISESKNPSSGLGSQYDIFQPNSLEDGYIPRVLRASLMMIDIVEPYVTIKSLNGKEIQDDIVPSTSNPWSKSKTISIPHGTKKIIIQWEVGGAFSVDTTNLIYVKLPDEGQTLNELIHSFYKSVDGDEGFFSSSKNTFYESPGKSGNTRWTDKNPFQAAINMTTFNQGDRIAVVATAQVDNAWGGQSSNVAPDLPPQTHLVNSRLNPGWYHENAGRVVKGKVQWFSIPVTLVIGPPHSKIKEMHPRIPLPSKTLESRRKIENIMFVAITSVLLFALVGVVVYRKRRPSLQKEQRKRKSMYSNDSDEYDDDYLEKIYKHSLRSLN